ncbi:MAG: helix-turn-helix transcriptional regulator [Pseudobdellovibrionaceae bacterium]
MFESKLFNTCSVKNAMLAILKYLSYILIMKTSKLNLEIDYQAYPGGFTCPLGRLTSRYINMSGPIGVAYERSINYEKNWHEHEEIDITFPQGSSRLEFKEEGGKKWLVSASEFLWMPAHINHRQRAISILWDNFALFPKPPSIETNLQRMKIKATSKLREQLQHTHVFARSPLLNDMINRVFQERIIAKKRVQDNFMDKVLEECLRIILNREDSDYQLKKLNLPLVDLALRFIEANLFNEISATSVAKAARTSTATLYRQFACEVGMNPLEVQRKRRLDESAQLLRSGKYSISDIALIVGYQDLAAFSKSFKHQFGISPREFAES